jgi:NlpC/P60 family putative phage cell wall peptidase
MPTAADIIAEARTWIGTPWSHQGRLKRIGVDCCGLIIGVARALGLVDPDFDIPPYSRFPDPARFKAEMDRFLDRVDSSRKKPADILWLRPVRLAQHVGIWTAGGMTGTIIHAIDQKRGVREHILDGRWQAAIVGVYRFRGLTEDQ